jgi:hypothetical protein
LFGLQRRIASGRRVTLRDDPCLMPRCVERDHTVTDQLATLVEENDISYQKARRGGGLHCEPIPLVQRRGHAPTSHPKAERLAAEEKVADFQEVCQAEPIGFNHLADPLVVSYRPGSLQFDQYGIAIFPKLLFDEKPCFLKFLSQLLGAEEMNEALYKQVAWFILPIEEGPSSQSHAQSHEQVSQQSLADLGADRKRDDEDSSRFQNRMRLPQETDPPVPWEEVAIGDIRQ